MSFRISSPMVSLMAASQLDSPGSVPRNVGKDSKGRGPTRDLTGKDHSIRAGVDRSREYREGDRLVG